MTSLKHTTNHESTTFAGKSILLISPKFFGYELAVRDKLSQMGSYVTMFDDRPSNSFFSKALIRLDKRLLKVRIDQYYTRILRQLKDQQFDIVFLLNPEALPISFLKACKSRWNDARYVMYMWDSIKNRKHTLEFVPFCDRVFTFDPDDAKLPNFLFRPLFYLDTYGDIRQSSPAIKYDICFMGTLHSDRYAIAKEIGEWCDQQGLRYFFYFFAQNRFLYYLNKFREKGNTAPRSEVSFSKMSTSEIAEIVASSKVVLDIQHPKQTGLTMRTLETIGAGRKLITTNQDIKKYDVYNFHNVAIADRSRPSENLNLSFFLGHFERISDRVLISYSIESWLITLLG